MQNRDQEIEDKKISGDEMVYRMSITSEAGVVLDRLVVEVNGGFVGGKISRQEVASWAIQKFAGRVTPADVKELRLGQMTDQALLRYCIEKTSIEGQMATELRQLLLAQCGLLEQPKKTSDKKVKDRPENESVREAA
jgi:hypothetical protein